MKNAFQFGPYLRLFWRPRVLLWIYAALINSVVVGCLLPNKASSAWFALGALLFLPLAMGAAHALILARVIHFPASMWLPGVRRYFRRMTALSVCATGGALLLFAQWTVQPVLPVAGSAGLVMSGLSLGLLWDPSARSGARGLSGWVMVSVIGALAAGLWISGGDVRQLTTRFPWALFVFGGGGLAASVGLMFDREQMRERARVLCPLFGGSVGALARERLRTQKNPGAEWLREPVGESAAAWRRVFWHEHFGAGPRRSLWVMLGLGALLAGAVVGTILVHFDVICLSETGTKLAQGFYSLVWFYEVKNRSIQPGALIGLHNAVTTAFPVVVAMTLTFPRSAMLYPVARRTLMRLLLKATFVRMAKVLFFVLGGVCLLAWLSCMLAGQAWVWQPAALFVLPLVQAPFIPLIALSGLSRVKHASRLGRPWSGTSLWLVMIIAPSTLISMFAAKSSHMILSPAGVGICVAATVATSALFVLRARKLFLDSDLVARQAA